MEKNKKRINPGEAIIPGITLAFGIAYFVQTRDASMVAIRWPYIIAALTAVLWLCVVVFFLFDDPMRRKKMNFNGGVAGKIGLILCAPIAYVFSMSYIGFGISSFIFLTVLFRLLGGTSWIRNLSISLVITTFLYVSMIVLMNMSLPRIMLGSFQI